jgi:very-short-patch-repair endonuclease
MIHLSHREYDDEKTKYLESSGLSVIRFNNEDIKTRIEWVLENINSYIDTILAQKTINHFPLGGNMKGGNNL